MPIPLLVYLVRAATEKSTQGQTQEYLRQGHPAYPAGQKDAREGHSGQTRNCWMVSSSIGVDSYRKRKSDPDRYRAGKNPQGAEGQIFRPELEVVIGTIVEGPRSSFWTFPRLVLRS